MRRIASIFLPALAIERWSRFAEAPDAAVALVIEAAHGQLIHAVTPAAATARRTSRHAPDRRPRARPEIARGPGRSGRGCGAARSAWHAGQGAGRLWSKWMARTGCGSTSAASPICSEGEDELAADMRARFAALGLTGRVAIAPTAGASWALGALRSAAPPCVDADELADALSLPPRRRTPARRAPGANPRAAGPQDHRAIGAVCRARACSGASARRIILCMRSTGRWGVRDEPLTARAH